MDLLQVFWGQNIFYRPYVGRTQRPLKDHSFTEGGMENVFHMVFRKPLENVCLQEACKIPSIFRRPEKGVLSSEEVFCLQKTCGRYSVFKGPVKCILIFRRPLSCLSSSENMWKVFCFKKTYLRKTYNRSAVIRSLKVIRSSKQL